MKSFSFTVANHQHRMMPKFATWIRRIEQGVLGLLSRTSKVECGRCHRRYHERRMQDLGHCYLCPKCQNDNSSQGT